LFSHFTRSTVVHSGEHLLPVLAFFSAPAFTSISLYTFPTNPVSEQLFRLHRSTIHRLLNLAIKVLIPGFTCSSRAVQSDQELIFNRKAESKRAAFSGSPFAFCAALLGQLFYSFADRFY
jgi:hypothetical protein